MTRTGDGAGAHAGDSAEAPARDSAGGNPPSDALLVAAGVADLVVSGIGTALREARQVLRRSDLAELAQDGQEEIRVRGRLALQRTALTGQPHMEALARRAAARSGRHDA